MNKTKRDWLKELRLKDATIRGYVERIEELEKHLASLQAPLIGIMAGQQKAAALSHKQVAPILPVGRV